jgi:hypothetical protein
MCVLICMSSLYVCAYMYEQLICVSLYACAYMYVLVCMYILICMSSLYVCPYMLVLICMCLYVYPYMYELSLCSLDTGPQTPLVCVCRGQKSRIRGQKSLNSVYKKHKTNTGYSLTDRHRQTQTDTGPETTLVCVCVCVCECVCRTEVTHLCV